MVRRLKKKRIRLTKSEKQLAFLTGRVASTGITIGIGTVGGAMGIAGGPIGIGAGAALATGASVPFTQPLGKKIREEVKRRIRLRKRRARKNG